MPKIDQNLYDQKPHRIVPDCYVREAEALHSRNVRLRGPEGFGGGWE